MEDGNRAQSHKERHARRVMSIVQLGIAVKMLQFIKFDNSRRALEVDWGMFFVSDPRELIFAPYMGRLGDVLLSKISIGDINRTSEYIRKSNKGSITI